MGFRLNRTYVLQFEGAMEGAEVRIGSTPVAVVLQFMERLPYPEIADLMVAYVQSWNLEDEKGEPLPIERDAIIQNMEEPVMAAIVRAWMRAARGVTAPLDPPPPEEFPEGQIPMDTLE